ncbi:PEB-1 protein [Aphelenchoides avenae]|nr:PEB-1 protein [Aphelenchus avenae]
MEVDGADKADVGQVLSKYETRGRAIKKEEAAKRREALKLSTDDSDDEDFVPARQRKKGKTSNPEECHPNEGEGRRRSSCGQRRGGRRRGEAGPAGSDAKKADVTQTPVLISVSELAKGAKYEKPIKRGTFKFHRYNPAKPHMVTSSRGNPKLIFEGYRYNFGRIVATRGVNRWQCVSKKATSARSHCNGCVETWDDDTQIISTGEHNHAAEHESAELDYFKSQLILAVIASPNTALEVLIVEAEKNMSPGLKFNTVSLKRSLTEARKRAENGSSKLKCYKNSSCSDSPKLPKTNGNELFSNEPEPFEANETMASPSSSARQCQEQENNEDAHSDASSEDERSDSSSEQAVVDSSVPALSDLLPKIRVDIRTTVETRSDAAVDQCKRIIGGLRLAEAAANDGDLRADILNIAPPRFCKRMYEKFARVNDRVVNYMALVDLYHHTLPHAKELPPFGIYCFAIQLKALKLLAVLKDHSRAHEELYWRYLEDDQLGPFLKFVFERGDTEMLYDALRLKRPASPDDLAATLSHATLDSPVGKGTSTKGADESGGVTPEQPSSSSESGGVPRGLHNFGLTCYANALLQAMFHAGEEFCYATRAYLRQLMDEEQTKGLVLESLPVTSTFLRIQKDRFAHDPIFQAERLETFLQKVRELSVVHFPREGGFPAHKQHDPHELFLQLMDFMQRELTVIVREVLHEEPLTPDHADRFFKHTLVKAYTCTSEGCGYTETKPVDDNHFIMALANT